jgi:hypothetical protein
VLLGSKIICLFHLTHNNHNLKHRVSAYHLKHLVNYRLALKFDPDEYVCSRLRLLSASFLSASFFCGKKDEIFLLSSESLIEKNEEQSGNEQRESSYSIDL